MTDKQFSKFMFRVGLSAFSLGVFAYMVCGSSEITGAFIVGGGFISSISALGVLTNK
jgi:hypothetical protein